MPELLAILIPFFGGIAVAWLKLRQIQTQSQTDIEALKKQWDVKNIELENDKVRVQLDYADRSLVRDDRWRDTLGENNTQWQAYARETLKTVQDERDRHVKELTEGIKQAQRDLEEKTKEAALAAEKYIQVITGLENKVTSLEQTMAALRNEIKVLTDQNTQLIKRKDVSEAEKETLSAEVEASQTTNPIEEQQDVA